MKGRVLFVLLLHVALASTLSGCRTADVVGGQAAHRAALQALSSRSCKIILEEVYTPSDRPEKLRAQQVTGSYLIIKGDKMLAYLTREDNSPKLFFGSSPLNDGEAALQMGVPETQKNGDVNITLRVQVALFLSYIYIYRGPRQVPFLTHFVLKKAFVWFLHILRKICEIDKRWDLRIR